MRSRSAASVLTNAGFQEVYSMSGGINAWNGLVASGPPEAGIAYFPDDERPEKIVALALLMEEGARRFYSGVEALLEDKEQARVFQELVSAEVSHKERLVKLGEELFGPGAIVTEEFDDVMEGGMRLSEALEWVKGRGIRDILEYSVAIETNAYDLYLKMARRAEGKELKTVFASLSAEEKGHLGRLASLLDERV